MLKLLLGAILGGIVYSIADSVILSVGVLAVVGVCSQVAYARLMHVFLDGADPVQKYGVRSLKELKNVVAVPSSIHVADLIAKSCGCGVLAVVINWLFF